MYITPTPEVAQQIATTCRQLTLTSFALLNAAPRITATQLELCVYYIDKMIRERGRTTDRYMLPMWMSLAMRSLIYRYPDVELKYLIRVLFDEITGEIRNHGEKP